MVLNAHTVALFTVTELRSFKLGPFLMGAEGAYMHVVIP